MENEKTEQKSEMKRYHVKIKGTGLFLISIRTLTEIIPAFVSGLDSMRMEIETDNVLFASKELGIAFDCVENDASLHFEFVEIQQPKPKLIFEQNKIIQN